MEYSDEFKRGVAKLLYVMPRGSQRRIAKALEVTERTLRAWKRSYPTLKRRGRRPKAVSLFDKLHIAREWKRQGYPGSRPVIAALPNIRVRAVRAAVSALKLRRRKRIERLKETVRVRIKVVKPKVFAVIDGATMSKKDDHIIYRDRGSLSVESTSCRGNLNAGHTMAFLQGLKAHDRLPLVLGSDNGSPFCAEEVEDFLAENLVVHLKSLPYVPQQNGSAENAVKETKQLVHEGLTPATACQKLNQCRRRPQLGWKTSSEYESQYPAISSDQQRKMFYAAARSAITSAVLGTKSGYAKRKAEREAILQTMENFSLITRTRGGLPYAAKPEAIT